MICNTGDFCHAIQCNFRHPEVPRFEMQFIYTQYVLCIFTQHEPDNPHDTHAVAVKRVQDQGGMPQIVGHVPLTLSRVFHLSLKHGGQISVEVTGKRRNKGIGLEIPATYSFYHKKPSKVKTLRELIRDKEDKAEVN